MNRLFSLLDQLGGLSWLQLCDPKADKLSASPQRTALAEHYAANPRLCRRCEAPQMLESEYDETIALFVRPEATYSPHCFQR